MGSRVSRGSAVVIAAFAFGAGTAHADAPPGEAARIVALMSPAVTGGSGGTAGVLVREAGSTTPVVAANNATPYEPASAMKVLLATAMERRVAAGADDYGNTIDAYDYPSNPRGRPADDANLCPVAVDETPANLSPVNLQSAQTQMMQVSNNRMTRAVLLRLGGGYAPHVTDLMAAAGMTKTTLTQDFVGCGNRDGKSNLTTLDDMSRLYAGVDTGTLLDPARRDHLYSTMNYGNWSADSAFGKIVAEEAQKIGGISEADQDAFRYVAIDASKGGSYTNLTDSSQTSRVGTAGMQRIPFTRPDGSTDVRSYTVGTFLDGRVCPTDCYDKVIQAAAATNTPGAAYPEAMRSVIRDALLSKRYPTDAAPSARFTVGKAEAGRSVALDAGTSTDAEGPIATYAWDFGDGTIASGAKVSHTFAAPGTYTVAMGATDGVGKTTTVTQAVTVTTPAPPAKASLKVRLAKKKVRRGRKATLRITSGTPATLVARVERRRGKRWTRVASLRREVPAGSSSVTLARVARLTPGRYRVRVTAGKLQRTVALTVTRR